MDQTRSEIMRPSGGMSRYVSISLADLGPPSPLADINAAPARVKPEQVVSSALLGTDSEYEKELLKLLGKSKGTPYEAAMRKFLESKISKGRKDFIPKSLDSRGEPEPRHVVPITNHPNIQQQQQKVIEDLSRPLDRNIKKEEPVGKIAVYASTNTLGRQRPAQKTPRDPTPDRTQVSVREFNRWLRRTKKWQDASNQAVLHLQFLKEKQLTSGFTPSIYPKSKRLAERAFSRERSRSLSMVRTSTAANDTAGTKNDVENVDSNVSAAPAEAIQAEFTANESETEWNKGSFSVYDRLSARGREYAFRRMLKTPKQLPFTFSPHVNKTSIKILQNAKKRSLSASRQMDDRFVAVADENKTPEHRPRGLSEASSSPPPFRSPQSLHAPKFFDTMTTLTQTQFKSAANMFTSSQILSHSAERHKLHTSVDPNETFHPKLSKETKKNCSTKK